MSSVMAQKYFPQDPRNVTAKNQSCPDRHVIQGHQDAAGKCFVPARESALLVILEISNPTYIRNAIYSGYVV